MLNFFPYTNAIVILVPMHHGTLLKLRTSLYTGRYPLAQGKGRTFHGPRVLWGVEQLSPTTADPTDNTQTQKRSRTWDHTIFILSATYRGRWIKYTNSFQKDKGNFFFQ